MHRIVLFINPVVSNGESLYGKLYGGANEGEILIAAQADFKTLLIREQWEGERGDAFRKREEWTLVHSTDGSRAWWSYDENKYTFNKGFDPIPDQFVENCPLPTESVALISGWVPLRMADTNLEDYIVNGAFYYMITNANPNNLQWTDVDEQEMDDLPF